MTKHQSTVYLICGFIGAGKSTFSRQLEKKTGAVRITKDEWSIRLIGNCPSIQGYEQWDKAITELSRDLAFYLAQKGSDIILDEGFWERATRDQMRERVRLIGAKCVIYYLATPIEEIRERVAIRNQNPAKDAFVISPEMLDHYLNLWEAPTEDEDVILIE